MHTPAQSEGSSHAESMAERLSIVQHELASHRTRQTTKDRATFAQCQDALSACKQHFHEVEERIALQSSDHRAELNLLESFIREALFKVEQQITGDAEHQFTVFAENAAVVDEKVKQLEGVVLNGEGQQSEEEQIGAIRAEMAAAVEAARQLCEDEEEQAKRELIDLTEPSHLKIRNLYEMADIEYKAVERVVEDARAQLLSLAAPPGQRLEPREKELAQALRTTQHQLQTLRMEREQTFALLYDSMTQLSNEMIKRAEASMTLSSGDGGGGGGLF